MKDITLLFSLSLALVLGVISLDHALDRVSSDAARRASHDLPGFYTSLETAKTVSTQSGKPLVVVLGHRSDEKTLQLKNEVLNSSAVNAIKSRYIWVYLDLDQARNEPYITQFDVFDTPVTCVLDQNGQPIQHIKTTSVPYLYVKQVQQATPDLKSDSTPASASTPSGENPPPQAASAAHAN